MGIVDNLTNAYSGKSSGETTLKDFLNKFGSTKGRYVDTLDPLTTFDVKFKFFPSIEAEKPKKKATKQKGSGTKGPKVVN